MIDKIEITFNSKYDFIFFVKEYCYRKLIEYKIGTGSKYCYQKGLFTEYFQVFWSEQEDDNITAFLSIGSKLSNKYGLYLVKHLTLFFGFYQVRIRRIDFCYDFIKEQALNFRIKKFNVKNKPFHSKPKSVVYYNSENPKIIDTSYLITSNFKIRVYDKGVEQNISKVNSEWKRFEIQFNKSFIDRYIKRKYMDFNLFPVKSYLDELLLLVNKVKELYTFNRPYMDCLNLICNTKKSLKPNKITEKTLSQRMAWFKKNYGAYLDYYFIQNEEYYKKLLNDEQMKKDAILLILDRFVKKG
jgi:hypothetical protein